MGSGLGVGGGGVLPEIHAVGGADFAGDAQ